MRNLRIPFVRFATGPLVVATIVIAGATQALGQDKGQAKAKAKAEEYVLDKAHTSIGFEIAHMVFSSVDGKFKKFDGSVIFNPDNLKDTKSFKITADVDVASIDTGIDKRDNHLRSPDFFDVKKHPKMKFVSKSVKAKGAKAYEMAGDLTIRGKTKPVTFTVKYRGSGTVYDKKRIAFKATAEINRKDFGLTWNDLVEIGPVVGDTVEIELTVEAIRKADM